MTTSGNYTQNFDALISTGTGTWTDNSTIANWYAQRTGNGTTIVADAGTNTGGNLYSYGVASSTDRALGSLGSGNAAAGSFAYGVLLRNTSGTTISTITVSYTLEQWRNSATAGQAVSFFYKTSSSPISALNPNSNATWTAFAGLNLTSPVTGGTAGALVGNTAGNKVSLSNITLTGLSLANNDYIMLKWDDPDHTGTDHGMGIDDVTITWTVPSLVTATLSSITQPTGSITQGTTDAVLSGFSLSATSSVDFSSVTVTGSGTATSTDITSVRIFRDNNGDGLINGADASVSGSGIAYGGSMTFTISGETGITTARNYLVVANVETSGISTAGHTVTASVASGAFVTTAGSNTGSSTGASRTIAAIAPTKLAITNINPSSPFTNTPFSVMVQAQDLNGVASNVTSNTDVLLTLSVGVGTLSGTLTGTITAGTNQVVISGALYNTAESGVVINASRTSGDVLSASNSSPFNVTVNVSPTITVLGSLSAFSTTAGTPSTNQSYSVSGSNLSGDIVIVPPAPFEISLTGTSGWVDNSGNITLTQSGGSVALTTIYVRFNPSTGGTSTGSITHTSASSNNPSQSVSGLALFAEPTAQSTISFGAVSSNSIDVNFSGGNGTSRIVMAYTSPVTFVPTDGVALTGVNANYASASDQGGGNKAVYDGTGNTVTVTGLAASTLYYFAVYEYNGTGTLINYYTVSPGTGSKSTVAAEPTTASTVTSPRIKGDLFDLTMSGGSGPNRIVVVNAGNPITFVPVDGTTYSGVNADFSLATDQGSGDKIVYSGSGAAVTVTGLTQGVSYRVRVYELNGTGITTNYLTSSFGSATVTTPSSLSYVSGTYTQTFDGLPASGTFGFTGFGQGPYFLSTPPVNSTGLTGWQFYNQVAAGNVGLVVDAGTSNSGATMSYGTSGNSDRALGSLASGSVIPTMGLVLQNDGAVPLSVVTISFTNEQWRSGANAVTNHILFEYSLNGTDIATGTFTPVSALDLNSIVTSNATGFSVNGNLPANQVSVSYTFTLNGNWLPGQKLVLRWKDANEANSDDGLAVDNFSFQALPPSAPTVQESLISFSTVLTNTITLSWVPGDGTSRVVKMSDSNTFTDPSDGSVYSGSVNTVYSGSGEQYIYDGTGSGPVTITNLTSNTTYYFRAYGYNGSGVATKYLTTTATDNPNSTTTAPITFPTQIVVLNVNNGADVIFNQPFTVKVQAQDNLGSPQPVSSNTTVTLSINTNSTGGSLAGGNVTGVMAAGTDTLTITGVIYDTPDPFVILDASASGLITGFSNNFAVYDVASFLSFSSVPLNGILNSPVDPIQVLALRPDATVDNSYNGSVTLSLFSGPGNMTGTLTVNCVNGVATFTNVQFDQVGNYTIEATSGTLASAISSNILINPAPALVELVVPKYFGSKTTGSANTARTPIAVCFRLDNLAPNTTYNLGFGLALSSESATTLGAGSIYNGISFSGQSRVNAFTTDANGSSGPVWVLFQPSGNSTRFAAGTQHTIRVAYSTGTVGLTANFAGTKTLTALDMQSTAVSTATNDDGAFITGAFSACVGGKYILIYDNTTGSGDPLYAYQSSPLTTGQLTQTDLPTSVDNIYQGLGAAGTFAGVIPASTTSTTGVLRVEARNSDNTIAIAQTDADGIWPSGANTTTATRHSVVALTSGDANLSTVSLSLSGINHVSCNGGSNGSITANATSTFGITSYLWSPGGATTATVSGLVAGTYSVVVTDGNGCTASASTTLTQPTAINIVGQVTNTNCSGGNNGAVDITVSGGTPGYTYSWSNGPTTEDITGLGVGSYTVIVSDANGCTASSTFSVVAQSSGSSVTATATPSSICQGQSSTLDATGASTYTWSPSATLSSSTGTPVTATPASTTTYTVSAVDGFGCQSITTVTVTVNPVPTTGVSPTSSTICEGSSVTLTASGATTYSWSPSTGLNATTGASVIASPTTTTSYVVVGSTAAGCTSSATTTITVNSVAAPTAVSPVTYCQGATASPLSATPTSGNSLWWYTVPTGGNAASTAPTPSTAIAGTTTYYVSQQASVPMSIAINGYNDNTTPDDFTFVALSKIPAGTTIYFTDNGWTGTGFRGVSATSAKGNEDVCRWVAVNTIAAGTVIKSYVSTADYTWTFSGAISCSTCTGTNNYAQLSISTTGDQIYAFTTTVTDNPLNATAQQIHLYVFDDTNGFEAATSAATGAIPPGLTSGVNANSFNAQSSNYLDLINDGATRTVSQWQTYISALSHYTVGTGTNPGLPSTSLNVDLGCESPRTAVVVNVNEAPVVSATSTPIACNGGSSTVTVSATGGTAPYTGTGSFTVNAGTYNYTVTDNNGCSGSTGITVTQPTQLTVTATPGAPIACFGGTTTVTVAASGGTAPYTGEGVFNVGAGSYSFTVTDANGCTATASGSITAPSQIVVSISATPIACPGGSSTVTVSATGGTGAYTGTGTFTVTAGTYSYTVTDANGCTGSNSITVNDPASIQISGFNPSSACPGSTVTINGSNLNLVTSIDFNGTSATFVLINSSEIQVTVPAGATTGTINLNNPPCSSVSTSTFTVTSCGGGMTLNLKVYLQGYYIGGGAMSPVIFNQGVFGATGGETDTIIVELHDENTFALADQTKGMLMTDGTCNVTFNVATDGNYYVAVRHRNSVLTWSATPVALSTSTPASYDFSTDPLQSMSGLAACDLSDGIYSIFTGDINQDEFVDLFDYPDLDNDNFNFVNGVYATTDLNGDGFVDLFDYPALDMNNYNFVSSVHP